MGFTEFKTLLIEVIKIYSPMYKWFLEPLCNHSKGRFFSRNFPSQNSQVTAGLPLLGGAESGMTRTTPWKVCPTIGRGLRLEIL